MRLSKDAFERVKKLRRDVLEISPAATRMQGYPPAESPTVDECVHPSSDQADSCGSKKEEDVAFACPHIEPKLPCCDEETRRQK